MTQDLFQEALNITDPWFVSDLQFDLESKKLDVYIDFKKGSSFSYEDIQYKTEIKKAIVDGKEVDVATKIEIGRDSYDNLKAYDTKDKTWRHLNFFEHPKSTSSLCSQRTSAIYMQEYQELNYQMERQSLLKLHGRA